MATERSKNAVEKVRGLLSTEIAKLPRDEAIYILEEIEEHCRSLADAMGEDEQ